LAAASGFRSELTVFAVVMLGCASLSFGQSSAPAPATSPEHQGVAYTTGEQLPTPQLSGTISGTVVDRSGAVVIGARVKLTREGPSPSPEVSSGDDGQFSFSNVPPGPFQLTVTLTGFATQTSSGTLHSGETFIVPTITLAVATAVTEVQVAVSPVEVAEEQLEAQEKQRIFGVLPNFYVSYVPDAVPLNSKQKFKLAWKTIVDPFTFIIVGGTAGVQQAQDHFEGYGQGAEGYAKRFGAGYADTVTGTFIGGAILPSLLKQDPRYFYRGHGSIGSRTLYAIASSVICKGDNRHWQANYSNILGSLAAGSISNLYYPADDRNGVGLTFENAAIGIGGTSVANLFQEFLVRKLTPKLPKRDPAKP
jgi:hypothetical protein